MGIEGKINNRYRTIRQIGTGGMAHVYLAEDEILGRQVAVKLIRTDEIPPSQLERVMERFRREAKNLARLTDVPGVVTLLDYGIHNNEPFLVMTYMSGGTLKDRMGTPTPVIEAAKMLMPVAETLSIVHEMGIVHRDIKPSNILIDRFAKPALADFGIAKAFETSDFTLTGTGLGVGTVSYMAPEQWRGKPETQSDLYSLGIIFYEMVTGRKPFEAETASDVFLKVMTEEVTDPREFVSSLDEHVVAFIKKAIARDLKNRHADAAEFSLGLMEITQPKSAGTPALDKKLTAKEPTAVDDETRDEYLDPLNPDETNLDSADPSAKLIPTPSVEDQEGVKKKAEVSSPKIQETATFDKYDPDETNLDEGVSMIAPSAPPSKIESIEQQREIPVIIPSEHKRDELSKPKKGKRKTWLWGIVGFVILSLLCVVIVGARFIDIVNEGIEKTTYAEKTQTIMVLQTNSADRKVELTQQAYQTQQVQEAKATVFQSTAKAEMTATQQAFAIVIEELESKAVLVIESESGELLHEEDDLVSTARFSAYPTDNFILSVDFINPYASSQHPWDFGVMFRHLGSNDQYRLVIESDHSWILFNRTEEDEEVIDTDIIQNLKTGEGEKNNLRLYVYDDIGYFFINDDFVSSLDLSDRVASGNILIGTGFINGSELDGEVTLYQNLNVWSLKEGEASLPSITMVEEDDDTYIHIVDEENDLDYKLGPVVLSKWLKPGEDGGAWYSEFISVSPNGRCLAVFQMPGVYFAEVGDQLLTQLGDVEDFSMYLKSGGLYYVTWLPNSNGLEVSEYLENDSKVLSLYTTTNCFDDE